MSNTFRKEHERLVTPKDLVETLAIISKGNVRKMGLRLYRGVRSDISVKLRHDRSESIGKAVVGDSVRTIYNRLESFRNFRAHNNSPLSCRTLGLQSKCGIHKLAEGRA
jgi:hypothetical protein